MDRLKYVFLTLFMVVNLCGCAYYDTPDGHFSVSFHRGEKGLTAGELSGIIRSMR